MTRRDPDAVTADATAATLAAEAPDPVVVLGLLVAWLASGLLAARVMADRGHDFRTVAGLAGVLGPLFVPLAIDHLRRRDPATAPVVLEGQLGDGPRTFVVLLGAPERAADARPVLGRLGDAGAVVLVVPVGFSTLRAPEHDDLRQDAVRRARQAAVLLHDLDPVTVLAPGTATDAVCRLAPSVDDMVLVVGDGSSGSRGTRTAHRATVLRAPADGSR